ncbi:polysaccharide lyase family 9 protein [Lentithecium fluviatile CBS 122367]|uniref:Polysaccharide lyase family 9 protein n=1 Tax=Lentithecium fluviatile CBS 122367 TaxID=1168545 RepID=A0A6G1JEN2_9PLEO|nr:polysaccharide lyase family 9 protein [Lentithecium fluviatile CBS 122367]
MELTILRAIFLILPSVLCADIYVSPSGSDTAAGTLTAPLKSIQSAVNKAVAGDTIFLRGGTYSPTTNIQVKNKSGTSSARITLTNYQSEVPVIDGEALPSTPAPVGGSVASADRGILHVEGSSYWTFKGLELKNGPYGVYAVNSNNNVFDRLVTHDNYETGFQLQGTSANNQILYLDSYMNRDPRKNGESADGIGIKEGTGTGNIVKGARLWNNVDDGLDLWEFKSKITIVDTISWGNGFNRWGFTDFAGDGNGFKLGGGDAADIGAADHNVTNCIAFGNAAKGFTDNSQPGNFVLLRNTAWNNPDVGFKSTTAVTTFTNNIAAVNIGSTTNSAQVSLNSAQKQSGNSWQGSATWTNSSFKSVDTSLVQGKRGSDGKIAASNFLLPASGAAIGATTSWS